MHVEGVFTAHARTHTSTNMHTSVATASAQCCVIFLSLEVFEMIKEPDLYKAYYDNAL